MFARLAHDASSSLSEKRRRPDDVAFSATSAAAAARVKGFECKRTHLHARARALKVISPEECCERSERRARRVSCDGWWDEHDRHAPMPTRHPATATTCNIAALNRGAGATAILCIYTNFRGKSLVWRTQYYTLPQRI